MKGITVVFENDTILVLNKPAGLPVQGGKGVGASLDVLAAEQWQPRPLLVHRLDRDTSGLILLAKTRDEAARCTALFAMGGKRGFGKRYLAAAAGAAPARGQINESLDVKGREKEASTSYVRLALGTLPGEVPGLPCSLLELSPATGRMHQIRRHLALEGYPILGDGKYGDFSLNRRLRKAVHLSRLLLHAASLTIPDPVLPGGLELSAPPPDHFLFFLEKAGIPFPVQNAAP